MGRSISRGKHPTFSDGAGYSSDDEHSTLLESGMDSYHRAKSYQEPTVPSSSSDSDTNAPTSLRAQQFNPNDIMDLQTMKEALNRKQTSSQKNVNQSQPNISGEILTEPKIGTPRGRSGEPPVKGILRTPRERFPEDPFPIREGVTPLKGARKDGIPPDARWTKISRKLVNPEALEVGKERFEAREDFLIVLRVLSREEVQAYAEATRRIRAGREELIRKERREEARKQQNREKYSPNPFSDSESENETLNETDHFRSAADHMGNRLKLNVLPDDSQGISQEINDPEELQRNQSLQAQPGNPSGDAPSTIQSRGEVGQHASGSDAAQQSTYPDSAFETSKHVQQDDQSTYKTDTFFETEHLSSGRPVILDESNPKEEEDVQSEASGRSAASSLASITESIFSMVSGSSMSSIAGPQSAVERLVFLLLDDSIIKSLCADALSTVERGRFERNLRRLLKEFAVGLRREADSEQERHASQFVRLRARNSAYMICSTLSKKKESRVDDIEVGYMSEESDSDRSDDEVDDLQQLERFIIESKAIETLRENLRIFVHPTDQPSRSAGVDNQEKSGKGLENHRTAYDSQEVDPPAPGHANHMLNLEVPRPKRSYGYPTIDNGDIRYSRSQREHRSLEGMRISRSVDRCRQGIRTPLMEPLPIRRPADIVVENYGDDGYGYTNPGDLAQYDLYSPVNKPRQLSPERSRRPLRRWPMEARKDHTPSAGIDDSRLPVPPPPGPLGGQELGVEQLREPNDEKIEKRIDGLGELLEISDAPIIRPERIQRGRTFRHFPAQLALMAKIGNLLSRRPPVVPEGKTRIEWKCKCGHTITDDFAELQPGAADRFRHTLNSSTSSLQSSKPSSFGSFSRTFSSGLQSLRSMISSNGDKGLESDLPIHELRPPSNPTDHRQPQTEIPLVAAIDPVYLLICYDEGKFATRLLQLDLTTLQGESDKALFQVLRKSYHDLRASWLSWISLRTLENIKFVNFEMYRSELVDVRKQDDVPPPGDAEYRYKPAPPELVPPVGSKYLMHVFQNPNCAEEESICFSRFPKKLKERLRCKGGIKPGWGLQFVEGWDVKKIWIIAFVLFGLGSLTIGIVWAVLERSIQDAFAIAAYMLAFASLSLGTVRALLVM